MVPRMIFGVHTGLQNTSIPELTDLWRSIEASGFDWISIWDHFYAADHSGNPHSLESVVSHAALCCVTTRVRCGSLVYSAGYRHPAVLANAMATLDQLSNGRVTLGLGGGWLRHEYQAYGIPFGSVGDRLRMMEESLTCIRLLLSEQESNFSGEFFTLDRAHCEPKPIQSHFPIWVGGAGEKVTLRIAAQRADGWNVPFISPEAFAHKNAVLDAHCERLGRDPSHVFRSVNVGIALSEESLFVQFNKMSEGVRPGVLMGSANEMLDSVGAYIEAGAQQVNLAMRAPFDTDAIDWFAAEVLPSFR